MLKPPSHPQLTRDEGARGSTARVAAPNPLPRRLPEHVDERPPSSRCRGERRWSPRPRGGGSPALHCQQERPWRWRCPGGARRQVAAAVAPSPSPRRRVARPRASVVEAAQCRGRWTAAAPRRAQPWWSSDTPLVAGPSARGKATARRARAGRTTPRGCRDVADGASAAARDEGGAGGTGRAGRAGGGRWWCGGNGACGTEAT